MGDDSHDFLLSLGGAFFGTEAKGASGTSILTSYNDENQAFGAIAGGGDFYLEQK